MCKCMQVSYRLKWINENQERIYSHIRAILNVTHRLTMQIEIQAIF